MLQFNHLSLSLLPVCLNLLAKLQRISVVLFSCQDVSRLNKCLFGVGTHIEGLKIRPCVGTPELLLHSSQVLQVVPFQPNNDEASKALARRLDLCATASAWHCWLLADPVTLFYEYGVALAIYLCRPLSLKRQLCSMPREFNRHGMTSASRLPRSLHSTGTASICRKDGKAILCHEAWVLDLVGHYSDTLRYVFTHGWGTGQLLGL